MSKLPYANSKADPARAQKRIRETLMKFGVDRIGFEDNFKDLELTVRFVHKDFPVSLPVNYGKLAELYLEEDPWTHRKRYSRDDWERDKREVAYRAAYSMLEDYLKGLVTLVELEVFSFEEIFMPYFTDYQGRRIGEMIAPRLGEFVKGTLALTEGEK